MNLETLRLLIPVIEKIIEEISEYSSQNVEKMTMQEVKQLLQSVSWPDLDFNIDE